jgi:hypothetical protein
VNNLIVSYAKSEIRAIGVVERECESSERPLSFGKIGEQWDKNGWLVHVAWIILDRPFKPKSYMSSIAPLLPKRLSPLQANGNGNQKCYLAEISKDLGDLILKIAKDNNEGIGDSLAKLSSSIADDKEEARVQTEEIPETDKQQLIKARRGQGKFRIEVEKLESACRMTGITDKRLLIASHIKPWREGDNFEKLDGHNGFLLSPHVDKLFDLGLISFSDEGRILCANAGVTSLMQQWGLDPNKAVGQFTKDQKRYLTYHREHIYQG